LVIAALLALPTARFDFRAIPKYKIGDIAVAAIKAPVEMTVPDEAATRKKRDAAANAVPAVFDVDTNTNAALETEVRNLFAQGRLLTRASDVRTRKRLGLTDSLLSRVHSQLQTKLGKQLTLEFTRILLIHGFSRDVENQIAELMQNVMRPGVINNRDLLVRFQSQGLVLRDISSNEEKRIRDVYAVRDLRQAKDFMRQKESDLYRLPEPERRVVISYLDGLITPNVSYNGGETRARQLEAARDVDPVVLQIKKGKTIVRDGDPITENELVQLESLRQGRERSNMGVRLLGAFALVCFLLLALWRYFVFFQNRNLKTRQQFLLVSLVLFVDLLVFRGFVLLSTLVAESLHIGGLSQPEIYYFAAPLVFGCMLVMLLLDTGVALIFSVILTALAGLLIRDSSVMIYTLLGSLVAIFTLNQYRERAAIIRCGLVVGAVNVLMVLGLNMIKGPLVWDATLVQCLCGFLGGIMAAMFTSLTLPLLETIFGITTDIKLLELSNLNTPILRRLALEAPGTYHHSIIVGTLAEAAAEAISANSLLVRVGAFYHDIGKIRKAEYYVENQLFTGNKHEQLTPAMSSLIISSHVRDGLEMADQIKLPQKIRDLIPQHHGTRLMAYFYQKAKDAAESKNQIIDENAFRYPGPKPQSREAALLMLADAVEAASRTLTDPTPNQILGMVKRIIYNTLSDAQFDECDITMKDLDLIAHAFMRVLTGMHHHRIDYPGFDFNKIEKESPRQESNQRIQ
jgi:hypothetical protein